MPRFILQIHLFTSLCLQLGLRQMPCQVTRCFNRRFCERLAVQTYEKIVSLRENNNDSKFPPQPNVAEKRSEPKINCTLYISDMQCHGSRIPCNSGSFIFKQLAIAQTSKGEREGPQSGGGSPRPWVHNFFRQCYCCLLRCSCI